MGVIKVSTPSLSRNTDYLIKRLLKFDKQQILKDHNTTITPHVPAEVNGLKAIKFKPLNVYEEFVSHPIDMFWMTSWLLRFREKLDAVPNWYGYMHTFYDSSNNYSISIDFLPIINLNPGDMNAIFSILLFCTSQPKKTNSNYL